MDQKQLNQAATHPLQSWSWGEFRKAWGNQVVRFPFGQITVHRIPLTPFKVGAFIKGPTPSEEMLTTLTRYAKDNRLLFIKLEPNVLQDDQLINLLKTNNCVKGRRLFTPSTFTVDLTKSEDELLKSFSYKTRYNIRLAQRHGVFIAEDNSETAFKKYLELTKETARRQGFYAHTEKYHQLMWQYLKPAGIAHLLTATYKKEIITTWILFVWKDYLYYPYGASSDKHKNVMANNLMMWEAIKFGKKHNLKTFDLWGKEEGKGFTKFKEGFNPQVIEFLGTWDLVTSPLYYLYRMIESFRWKLLRLKSRVIKPRF